MSIPEDARHLLLDPDIEIITNTWMWLAYSWTNAVDTKLRGRDREACI